MRKQMKRMVIGLAVTGLVLGGFTTGGNVYAADTVTGAAGALVDTEYSIQEMLVYAIEDEYLAQAEYNVIMGQYGVVKPFSNIIKSEATHISLLLPLLVEYGVEVPVKDFESMVIVPESLEAAYEIGVKAEEKNIAMYESFLKEDLPEDVKVVFERLKSASENHLRAFQNAVEGKITGLSGQNKKSNNSRQGNGKGNGKGNGQGNGQGNGGNRNSSKGSCLLS